jgi:Cu/Ag efflux pump CusA
VPVLGALNSGLGREMREPMAITVIAGLLSATLLTLLVIPSFTHAVESWRARRRAARAARAAPVAPVGGGA